MSNIAAASSSSCTGDIPSRTAAAADADATITTEVPYLIREALYAPTSCPPAVAELMEVARVHHDDGELERAVEVYGAALAAWEEAGAEARLEEFGVTAAQVGESRAEFQARATSAINTVAAQVNSVHSVMSQEDKDAEIAREVAVWEEKESRLMNTIADKQAEALSVGVLALVPVEGRVFYHLAVGAVFDTAGLDENALREYLEALRLLREMHRKIFHMQLMTATVYSALGVVYFHLSQYDFAADYFFRALEIREENLPENHVDVAATLNNIGATLLVLKRPADALVLISRARTTMQDQLPAHHSRNWIVSMNETMAKKRGVGPDAAFLPVPFEVCKPPMIKGAKHLVVSAGMQQLAKEQAAAAKAKEKSKGRR